jgi:Iap family predicted aminopeptidase
MATCTHRVLLDELHNQLLSALAENAQFYAKRVCTNCWATCFVSVHYHKLVQPTITVHSVRNVPVQHYIVIDGEFIGVE